MGKKVCLYKRGGAIFAVDEEGKDAIRAIPNDSFFMAELFLKRNPGNHRRFFAFLQTVFDMQDHFPTIEHLRYWLIMKAGWYETIQAPNGTIIFKPKSIAWDRMEEIEFRKAFSHCIDVVCREFALDHDQLCRVLGFA